MLVGLIGLVACVGVFLLFRVVVLAFCIFAVLAGFFVLVGAVGCCFGWWCLVFACCWCGLALYFFWCDLRFGCVSVTERFSFVWVLVVVGVGFWRLGFGFFFVAVVLLGMLVFLRRVDFLFCGAWFGFLLFWLASGRLVISQCGRVCWVVCSSLFSGCVFDFVGFGRFRALQ